MYNSDSLIDGNANWVKISGSFMADSNYRFVIIGNFKSDNFTKFKNSNSPNALDSIAYYNADDICVSDDSFTFVSKAGIKSIKKNSKKLTVFPNPLTNKNYNARN